MTYLVFYIIGLGINLAIGSKLMGNPDITSEELTAGGVLLYSLIWPIFWSVILIMMVIVAAFEVIRRICG